ncbi:MAG TPA: exodeoxyribonuclease VII small subunit [bacterium]|nr:exodeoxyribonuclease VII small subunit [bacterium]
MTTQEIQFEKALSRLEKLVEELESGNISLDEALKKYEEGVKLSRACQEKLAQAEKKIEILSRSLNGTLKKEPFVFDEDEKNTEEAAPRKKRPGKSTSPDKPQPAGDDEDLLF